MNAKVAALFEKISRGEGQVSKMKLNLQISGFQQNSDGSKLDSLEADKYSPNDQDWFAWVRRRAQKHEDQKRTESDVDPWADLYREIRLGTQRVHK